VADAAVAVPAVVAAVVNKNEEVSQYEKKRILLLQALRELFPTNAIESSCRASLAWVIDRK